jgi:copper chaperone CopZ
MPGLWRIVFPNAQPATCATTLTDAAQVALAPRVVKVEGMTCHKCARYVTESIQTVEGVQSVHVDLEGKQATVTGDFDVEKVKKAVEDAGYKTQ